MTRAFHEKSCNPPEPAKTHRRISGDWLEKISIFDCLAAIPMRGWAESPFSLSKRKALCDRVT